MCGFARINEDSPYKQTDKSMGPSSFLPVHEIMLSPFTLHPAPYHTRKKKNGVFGQNTRSK